MASEPVITLTPDQLGDLLREVVGKAVRSAVEQVGQKAAQSGADAITAYYIEHGMLKVPEGQNEE